MIKKKDCWESVQSYSCVRAGQFPEDCSTAVMAYAPPYIYQLRWKHLERYDPRKDTWHDYPGVAVLPEIVGPGTGIVYDGRKYLYITRGGRMPEFYRYEIKTGKIKPLAPLSYYKPVGIGGWLAYKDGFVYCLRGDCSPDFLRYNVRKDAWEDLPPLAACPSLYIGVRCTGLVAVDGCLLAWPDHHVRSFNIKKGAWESQIFGCTMRPSVNGGMLACDAKGKSIYIVQGDYSMTIGKLDISTKKFSYLSPRLPDVVSVPGNRLVIAEVKGVEYLYLYRGHATTEFWRIRKDALSKISSSANGG